MRALVHGYVSTTTIDKEPATWRCMSSKLARGWVLALMAVASSMAALDTVVASLCSLGPAATRSPGRSTDQFILEMGVVSAALALVGAVAEMGLPGWREMSLVQAKAKT